MSALGTGWRYLRRHGVMPAIQRFITRWIYRSKECVVFDDRMTGQPVDDRVGDVVFRVATASDLDHLDELEPYGRGSSERAYVQKDGDWLFVACHGERIVATARYGLVIRDDFVSDVFHLEARQVWGADQFCLPNYRNRGISRLLALFANRYLASLGYTSVATSVLMSNKPSLRMTVHKGCKPLYYRSSSRILVWERQSVWKSMPRRYWKALR